MPFFAHTETGKALDVHEHPDIAGYQTWAACVPGSNAWTIVEVPKNTVHGATPDGQGGWTNPTPNIPVHVPTPVTRSRDEIIEALPAGVMKACRDSADAGVIKQFYKFLAKGGFTKNEGIALGSFLESKSIITAQQNTDFVAAWPEA